MRSVIVALALSSASALVAPSAPRASTKLSAATKDPATTSYQPTEGANAAVDTNNKGDAWVSQMQRPRRNRKSAGVRSMVRENFLTPANLMQPIFIHEDSDQVVPIPSMPGQSRHTLDSMVEQVKKGMALGVKSFILFPKVPDDLKTNFADECYNPDGIVPRAVAMCKAACPEATICTDIALDPYSDQGHDGIVLDGKIVNDMTIEQLCKQAVCHARAGAATERNRTRRSRLRDGLRDDAAGMPTVSVSSSPTLHTLLITVFVSSRLGAPQARTSSARRT